MGRTKRIICKSYSKEGERMIKDPQQELFTQLLILLKEQGYDVYDGALPPESTPYPFIYLADNIMNDDYGNKSLVLGTVLSTIHVWHNSPLKRGTVSNILNDVKSICRSINKTGIYSWQVTSINQRIIHDTTTKQPLLHGVLEVNFRLLGGKEE